MIFTIYYKTHCDIRPFFLHFLFNSISTKDNSLKLQYLPHVSKLEEFCCIRRAPWLKGVPWCMIMSLFVVLNKYKPEVAKLADELSCFPSDESTHFLFVVL